MAHFTDFFLSKLPTKPLPNATSLKRKLPKVSWFKDVRKQSVRELIKAQRKLFHNRTAERVLAFEQLKVTARHIIIHQKKTSWQNLGTSLNSKTKPKTLWKAISKIKGKSQLPL